MATSRLLFTCVPVRLAHRNTRLLCTLKEQSRKRTSVVPKEYSTCILEEYSTSILDGHGQPDSASICLHANHLTPHVTHTHIYSGGATCCAVPGGSLGMDYHGGERAAGLLDRWRCAGHGMTEKYGQPAFRRASVCST
eukprot:280051-Chlamydomonas_euryale.AAC.3